MRKEHQTWERISNKILITYKTPRGMLSCVSKVKNMMAKKKNRKAYKM